MSDAQIVRRTAKRIVPVAGLILLFFCPSLRAQTQPYVIKGTITRSDFESYKLLPFAVPPGTKRITIEFSYTGREQRTVIDLGLFDPERFRGWSGGNKSSLTISEVDATPSYLPGSLPSGTWRLLLGVPNIRANVTSEYTARIFLEASVDSSSGAGLMPTIIRAQPGWYRGDLHAHTGHSDGSCASLTGKKVPCPEFKLLEMAAQHGLNFVAITDHNTTSTYNALLQWQPYFDTLALLRGREITTFYGHANIYGTGQFIDFRLGADAPAVSTLFREIHRAGAIVSINHPQRSSGEDCMGCGWTAKPKTDFSLVDAVEAVNGSDAGTQVSGIPFWEEQLNLGHRITAIGGSDDHASGTLLPAGQGLGIPTTVVYAPELSESGILQGIKAGHVYLKLGGPDGPDVLFTATHKGNSLLVGDSVSIPRDERIAFAVQVVGGRSATIEVVHNGKSEPLVADPLVRSTDEVKSFEVVSDGQRHWYRINLRALDGTLLVLTNPIYLNFP